MSHFDINSYSNYVDNIFIMNQQKKKSYENNTVKNNNWNGINNHNISCCYTPGDNIFINIISNCNYKSYSNYIKEVDINQNLGLFYTLICRTLDSINNEEKSDKYNLIWFFDNNLLKLTFLSVLDDYYPIKVTIELVENILSGDKIASFKMIEMESKIVELKNKLDESEKEILVLKNKLNDYDFKLNEQKLECQKEILILKESIENEDIYYGYSSLNNDLLKAPKNIIELIFKEEYVFRTHELSRFTNLKKISINSKHLLLLTPNNFNIKNIEKIEIFCGTDPINQYLSNLKDFINLKEIIFNNNYNEKIEILNKIKPLTKLKKIGYYNSNIKNIDEEKVIEWCDRKNIDFEVKEFINN